MSNEQRIESPVDMIISPELIKAWRYIFWCSLIFGIVGLVGAVMQPLSIWGIVSAFFGGANLGAAYMTRFGLLPLLKSHRMLLDAHTMTIQFNDALIARYGEERFVDPDTPSIAPNRLN